MMFALALDLCNPSPKSNSVAFGKRLAPVSQRLHIDILTAAVRAAALTYSLVAYYDVVICILY